MSEANDGSGAETSARLRRRRRRTFKLVLLGGALLGVELGSAAVLAIKPRVFGARVIRTQTDYAEQRDMLERFASEPDSDPEKVFVHDPELGWTVRRGVHTARDAINAQGLRSERTYTPTPPPGVLRVALFGDSFVYATEVATPDSWPAQVERAHPQLELLNYGVAGYGPDQALLRYRAEGTALAPHVVLLAVADPNVQRVVNRYRHLLFRNREELGAKPRFVLDEEGELRLVPNPLPRRGDAAARAEDVPGFVHELREHERFYEPAIYDNPLYDWSAAVRLATAAWVYYRHRLAADAEITGASGDGVVNPDSEAFAILTHLLLTFQDEVLAQGAQPGILVLPTQDSVDRRAAGGRAICQPLVDYCREQGLRVFDASEAFTGAEGPSRTWFMPHGHYSPAGNQRVADWLAAQLEPLRTPGAE